ncbi:HMO1 (YDR174W) [Zygosaccharomyces parabailii]|uniref:BN860_12838g1_1 n=1 Tax=Zygosaccharomyces bailii (strain CLIB 213 / ATCC 58445 / CBS 680 / BCRC 21525 / NBRC 1098 / NCYC 1416 / NRRL Y-2227) TaxID=1333698 RepID=A0A8J2T5S0_ZYGB2|nr:HMO1 (YDR174W) [Zygosaccharomyces parabailii]CDF87717.1 BN860_12838g1_1 [Zygosaccharomyces bailii CLIB 213]CDH09531.1 probable High mobility group protein 1 [Zygosaccharomyces bailii ISA1307]SJM83466.1 probable High mobility group protein 1 [Zygosaccharomyces bailii]
MTNDPSLRLKSAKDSLVSSLFELSKCADQTASSIVEFYNAVGDDEEEKIEAFTTLTEALQRLAGTTNQINGLSHDLINPAEDEKDALLGAPSPGKAPRKRAERDPNAPKKPLTVFFAYSAFVRQELRDSRQRAGLPPLSSTEITQEISKKWKELSDAEKEKWKQAYSVELEHYQLEKQKYLEAKKNGIAPSSEGPSHAPVPIPFSLQHEEEIAPESQPAHEKRPHDDHGSEKKKKKKKKDKKKDANV